MVYNNILFVVADGLYIAVETFVYFFFFCNQFSNF